MKLLTLITIVSAAKYQLTDTTSCLGIAYRQSDDSVFIGCTSTSQLDFKVFRFSSGSESLSTSDSQSPIDGTKQLQDLTVDQSSKAVITAGVVFGKTTNSDVLVIKVEEQALGNLESVTVNVRNKSDYANAVTSDGNFMYVAGYSNSDDIPGSDGTVDAYVWAYPLVNQQTGSTIAWTGKFNRTYFDSAESVAAHDSVVYMGGLTGSTGFVAAFSSGVKLWSNVLTQTSGFYKVKVYNNMLYAVGYYTGTLDGVTSNGEDILVTRYNLNGGTRDSWSLLIGNAASEEAYDFVIDGDNLILAASNKSSDQLIVYSMTQKTSQITSYGYKSIKGLVQATNKRLYMIVSGSTGTNFLVTSDQFVTVTSTTPATSPTSSTSTVDSSGLQQPVIIGIAVAASLVVIIVLVLVSMALCRTKK